MNKIYWGNTINIRKRGRGAKKLFYSFIKRKRNAHFTTSILYKNVIIPKFLYSEKLYDKI